MFLFSDERFVQVSMWEQKKATFFFLAWLETLLSIQYITPVGYNNPQPRFTRRPYNNNSYIIVYIYTSLTADHFNDTLQKTRQLIIIID